MDDVLTPAALCVFCSCLAGCRLLQDLEVGLVEVDGCGDAQSAAEGAVLGLFHYDQLKSKKKAKVTTKLHRRLAHQCNNKLILFGNSGILNAVQLVSC